MNSKNLTGKLFLYLLLVSILSIVGPFIASAQAEQKFDNVKTREVPAIRAKVYDQLARAQAFADEDKAAEAIEALDNVQGKLSSMNSYERAMLWNFYAFIYYQQEQYPQAITHFEKVIVESPIPEPFEMSTLFSLAQLEMMQGNFDQTITYLDRWENLNKGEVPASNYYLKAQAMYQKKSFDKAASYINQAIDNIEKQDKVADENWYVLQRAVYYELKLPEKVKDVLVKMVKYFNKPAYWTQLSGMYGELGQEKQQLAILESAYQQGFVTSAGDLNNLAQLYYYHGAPYKGAELLEKGMDNGVVEKNLRNMKFLAQSWMLAQEQDKAIPVLLAAAEMSDNGELNTQLAQLYLNMEKWSDAVAEIEKALKKGGLFNPGTAYLVLGMALYNQEDYVAAMHNLGLAEQYDNSKHMAKQWKQYVLAEKNNASRLESVGA